MGAVPPLNDQEWQDAFDAYKAYPEYNELNTHFTISDFKQIFFWEFLHRFLGRFIGLVFFFPFLYFLIKGYFTKKFTMKLLALMLLGAFQGVLGWYMVQSGLISEPRVSHFRLAAHLTTALLTMMYIVVLFLEVRYPEKTHRNPSVFRNASWVLLLLVVQIVFGAFVAGRDAGTIHNFYPHMNPGEFISPAAFGLEPLWKNFIYNNSGIQFIHRYLAYVVVAAIIWLFFASIKKQLDTPAYKALRALPILVLLQFILGVITLLYAVPVALGLLHQLGAVLLLSALVVLLQRTR